MAQNRPRKPLMMRERVPNKTIRGMRVYNNKHLLEKEIESERIRITVIVEKVKRNKQGTYKATITFSKYGEESESISRRGFSKEQAREKLYAEFTGIPSIIAKIMPQSYPKFTGIPHTTPPKATFHAQTNMKYVKPGDNHDTGNRI